MSHLPDASPGSGRRKLALLYLCFFGSGLAALIYQTAWTRQLALVFGSSELAVATVLAAYMGGLAVGAAVAGRMAHRVVRPVLWYGWLELGIALGALAVPLGLRLADLIHVAIYGAQAAPPAHGGFASAMFYLVATFALLLPSTALMGATLPLLARHAVSSNEELGGRIAQLYALNTFGAVAGTLLTAFVLLPLLGLAGTVGVAVATNAAVFLAAAAMARRIGGRGASGVRSGSAPSPRRFSWIGPAIAVSGMLAFTYEVLWSRLLVHVLGGSVDAFAVMLASFLLGIALGSLLAARSATDPRRAAEMFGISQLTIAILALVALRLVDGLPDWMQASTAAGPLRLGLDAAAAIVILLPLTIGIGATFPLAVRILARGADDAASASATIYAWNTVGAVVGAVGAGFFVLPWLGFAGTVAAAIACHVVLALVASERGAGGSRDLRIGAVVVVGLALLLPPADPEALLRSSPLDLAPSPGRISSFEVGRSATVVLIEDRGSTWMRTNGLPEAQITPKGARANRAVVGIWLSTLPSLMRPETASMMVVGLGGGTALEFLPAQVEAVDVIELEPAVVRANEQLADRRARDPLADPRVRVIVNDARSALSLTDRRYDAIVSQPSHPWTAGSAHLYTREFMVRIREHLEPGGVLVQWMGLPFVDEPLLAAVLATIRDVFPEVQVFQPTPYTMMFAASDQAIPVVENVRRALATDPELFAEAGLLTPEDVLAHWVLDAEGASAVAASGEIILDDRNLLQMRSPAVVRRRFVETAPQPLFPEHDPLHALPTGLSRPWITWRLAAGGMFKRAQAIAAAAPEEAARARGIAALHLALGQRAEAAGRLAELGAGDPFARHAGWLASPGDRPENVAHDEFLLSLAKMKAALEAKAFAEALLLEPELARIAPPSILYREASRLRAQALLSGRPSPESAQRALAILDRMMPLSTRPADILMRARASVAAGQPGGAIWDLQDIALDASFRPSLSRAHQKLLRRASALADRIPAEAFLSGDKDELVAALRPRK